MFSGSSFLAVVLKIRLKFQRQIWGLRYKTMYRWKIVLTSEYKSDRQISMWPAKIGNNCISGTLTDSVEIPTPIRNFR